MRPRRLAVLAVVSVTLACAEAPQLKVIGADEEAQATGRTHTTAAHVHFDSTMDLPSDAQVVEPAQPYAGTDAERVLAHVHTSTAVCSGVLVGPKLIATAHQCVGGTTQGIAKPKGEYRIEIASGSLTWTTRAPAFIVAPACAWEKLDLAVLVLGEAVDWIKPAPLGTVPGPGAKVQALGFGHCAGQGRGISDKAGSIVNLDSDAFVVDVGLCKGDVGGFVIDGNGSFLGIISHQDDPDDSPRHTTTIFRADTRAARALVAQAQSVAAAEDPSKLPPVPCD
jgi:hypothetical protein